MRSTTSYLLALTAVLVLLLSYCALTSLGQHCQSAAEDGSGDCSVLSMGATCSKQHPEQDLEYCSNLISFDELDERVEQFSQCDNHHTINEENLPVQPEIERLSIEIHSIDMATFSLKISWHHQISFNMRYDIEVKDDGFEDDYFSSCNSNDSIYAYSFDFSYDHTVDDFTVTITPEFGIFKSVSRSRMWPRSCLDTDFYNSSTCGPPRLNSPENITAIEICNPNTDNFTFLITWDQEVGNFPIPTEYYIQVFSIQNVSNVIPDYRFMANGTKSVLIQLPHRLNYSLQIRAYSNCSGVANYSNVLFLTFGCGIKSDEVPFKLCNSTTSTTLPTALPTTMSTKPTEPTILFSTPRPPITNFSPIAGCAAIPIVFIISFSIFVVYKRRKRKNVFSDGIVPPPPPPVDYSVFLMHSPQDNSMKDIQTYMVCPLQKFFDVATSGDKMCGDLVEWIEVQVRQRTAVLLVFTKEFYSEWESDEAKSQVVQAAQRLLTSAVAQELLDKYAIVVLDEETKESFIPDNHFLKSMGVYVLGRKKSEIERLYRFVTKTKSFEHEARPSSSLHSSSSSNDLGSQCMLSTGVPSLQNDLPPKELSHQEFSNFKTNGQSSSRNDEVRLSEALLERLRTPPPTSDNMYSP